MYDSITLFKCCSASRKIRLMIFDRRRSNYIRLTFSNAFLIFRNFLINCLHYIFYIFIEINCERPFMDFPMVTLIAAWASLIAVVFVSPLILTSVVATFAKSYFFISQYLKFYKHICRIKQYLPDIPIQHWLTKEDNAGVLNNATRTDKETKKEVVKKRWPIIIIFFFGTEGLLKYLKSGVNLVKV